MKSSAIMLLTAFQCCLAVSPFGFYKPLSEAAVTMKSSHYSETTQMLAYVKTDKSIGIAALSNLGAEVSSWNDFQYINLYGEDTKTTEFRIAAFTGTDLYIYDVQKADGSHTEYYRRLNIGSPVSTTATTPHGKTFGTSLFYFSNDQLRLQDMTKTDPPVTKALSKNDIHEFYPVSETACYIVSGQIVQYWDSVTSANNFQFTVSGVVEGRIDAFAVTAENVLYTLLDDVLVMMDVSKGQKTQAAGTTISVPLCSKVMEAPSGNVVLGCNDRGAVIIDTTLGKVSKIVPVEGTGLVSFHLLPNNEFLYVLGNNVGRFSLDTQDPLSNTVDFVEFSLKENSMDDSIAVSNFEDNKILVTTNMGWWSFDPATETVVETDFSCLDIVQSKPQAVDFNFKSKFVVADLINKDNIKSVYVLGKQSTGQTWELKYGTGGRYDVPNSIPGRFQLFANMRYTTAIDTQITLTDSSFSREEYSIDLATFQLPDNGKDPYFFGSDGDLLLISDVRLITRYLTIIDFSDTTSVKSYPLKQLVTSAANFATHFSAVLVQSTRHGLSVLFCDAGNLIFGTIATTGGTMSFTQVSQVAIPNVEISEIRYIETQNGLYSIISFLDQGVWIHSIDENMKAVVELRSIGSVRNSVIVGDKLLTAETPAKVRSYNIGKFIPNIPLAGETLAPVPPGTTLSPPTPTPTTTPESTATPTPGSTATPTPGSPSITPSPESSSLVSFSFALLVICAFVIGL
eukprot:TRINITY_DN8901_c0_g1_i2.p1 TRINITY_DN8901_c0_g1~~TRINITY_DN8901_c0_g1_i2.p1  ORF type:complete len:739 (+),score=143.53 TRINITY_DN8901_c0_g1_i2:82-2298(+)